MSSAEEALQGMRYRLPLNPGVAVGGTYLAAASTGRYLAANGLGRRQLRFVLAWAELHQDELAENWRRARAGETLQQVEPLR